MRKIIPLFLLVLISVFSCSTSSDVSVAEDQSDVFIEEVASESASEPLLTVVDTPAEVPEVKEDVPAVVEEPVVQPKAPSAEIDEVLISRTISLFGYSANIDAYDGYALVEYPSIVTENDLLSAIGALNAAYPGAFEGVYYELVSPGCLKVLYPKGLSVDFLNKTIDSLLSDLSYYVSTLFAPSAPVEDVPVVVEESVEVAPVVTEEPVVETEAAVKEEEVPAAASTVVPAEEKKEDVAKVESAPAEESSASFPTPVLDDNVSPVLLQVLSVVIVSTVIFTVSVAIRGANKLKLQKGISIALSLLFPALSIVVSTLVAGWSNIWLIYLVLLLTYFIFRAEWRGQSHFS